LFHTWPLWDLLKRFSMRRADGFGFR
jgi:hypothetical protein